jgi:hypothetical protein
MTSDPAWETTVLHRSMMYRWDVTLDAKVGRSWHRVRVDREHGIDVEAGDRCRHRVEGSLLAGFGAEGQTHARPVDTQFPRQDSVIPKSATTSLIRTPGPRFNATATTSSRNSFG